eukprot:GDKJ01010377.1.p1 GENE.GDKJ01010377.1~~GDKJ01010377.1.p1  ORF type:complete len:150 (+),score=0.75 GDKJ01010377.1:33-482(+)
MNIHPLPMVLPTGWYSIYNARTQTYLKIEGIHVTLQKDEVFLYVSEVGNAHRMISSNSSHLTLTSDQLGGFAVAAIPGGGSQRELWLIKVEERQSGYEIWYGSPVGTQPKMLVFTIVGVKVYDREEVYDKQGHELAVFQFNKLKPKPGH